MGGTTPKFGFPYPTGTDRVADGDNAIQALATKVEAELANAWVPLTLFGASWTVIAGYGPPAVRRMGGVVFMRGLIANTGSTTSGVRIVDPLPVGYRPISTERYPCLCYITANALFGTLQVDPNGVVILNDFEGPARPLALTLTASWPVAA